MFLLGYACSSVFYCSKSSWSSYFVFIWPKERACILVSWSKEERLSFTGIFLLEQIARASSFLLRRMYTLMLLPFVARAILAFASILLFCNCIPLVIRYFSNGKKYANSEFACRTAFSRKQPVILFQFYTHNFHVQNREMDPEVGQIGRRWMIFALDASLFFSCSFPPPNEMALLSGEPHIWWI